MNYKMLLILRTVRSGLRFCATGLIFLAAAVAGAQGDPPPAQIMLESVEQGRLAPTSEYKATVYFQEVSDLASEVSGKVLEMTFEEGDRVEAGAQLIQLDDDVLRASLDAARALAAQQQTLLEQERVRLNRARELLAEEVTTQQQFDDIQFTVQSLEHAVSASAAEVARLEEELRRKSISAPFPALVVEERTDVGEWVNPGTPVAVIARENAFDVVVNVPEEHVRWNRRGREVQVEVGGETYNGVVTAVLPVGDVATRTFPVKIRLNGAYDLLEGMSASVRLPIGEEQTCLMAPRDAVLLQQGQHVVYIVQDGQAQPAPVELLGYEGMQAGIRSPQLNADARVAVKGHERLRPGQPVMIAGQE